MNSIQRAIKRQAKIEAEASKGPWHYETCYGVATITADKVDVAHAVEYLTPDNATLIAHLRNQAKLARAVIEAAHRHMEAMKVGPYGLVYELKDAIQAWAAHVNGEGKL